MISQGEMLEVTYVVKRIKKRVKSTGEIRYYYYVYRQERKGDKVFTKYIGPLENIVEFYLKNLVRGVGFEPTMGLHPPDLESGPLDLARAPPHHNYK